MNAGENTLLKIRWKELSDGKILINMIYKEEKMDAEKIVKYLRQYADNIEKEIESEKS